MKDKFVNFPDYGNDDIKAFIEKLNVTHKKWIKYNRNNFKTNSHKDIVEMICKVEEIKCKRMEQILKI